MLEGAQQAMLQKAMSKVTPSETAVAKALATIIARLEYDQAEAMQRLADAAGMDAVDVHHDQDAREEQLLDLADAVAEDTLPEFYLGEVVDVDDANRALSYLGADEWPEQKREWYAKYRERDIIDGPPLNQADQSDHNRAADLHVQEVFGLRLREFERHVVEWDRGEAMQELLAGPLVGHTRLINKVADAIEDE
jgi:hypothetical protein